MAACPRRTGAVRSAPRCGLRHGRRPRTHPTVRNGASDEFVAWFEIVVGVSIAGLWTMLLSTGQVPEIAEWPVVVMFAVLATAAVVTSVILLRSSTA